MKIEACGENALIKRIQKRFLPDCETVVEIGDDCAATHPSRDLQLTTTDLLIENVHFRLCDTTPEQLGEKSLAVNLSDIAAMGGKAQSVQLALALPARTELSWFERLIDGIAHLAERYGVTILGGDITRSEQVVISITVLGSVANKQMKRRSGGKVGDLLCTTGVLGDAAAGLHLLTRQEGGFPQLINAQLSPRPHLAEGEWLAQWDAAHALMDISDGLASDLPRLASASKVGATLDFASIPLSSSLRQACAQYGWDPLKFALCGGEDYALLCALAADRFEQISTAYRERFQAPLYPIGTLTEEKHIDLGEYRSGYDHFAHSSFF